MFDTIWYDNLNKPFLAPPEWIFSPFWIILYATLLISIILYSIKITNKNKINGYICFIVQMIFNLLWSPVFFILHKINIAVFIVLIMDITTIVMIKRFYDVSKISGIILLPYLFWILFATYLNIAYLLLN